MKAFVFLALALGIAACANNNVIVDTKGADMTRYEQDRRECEAYAGQVSTGQQAAKSGGFGAVVGAAVGAIFGNSTSVVRGAGTGAVLGGAQGAVKGEGEKEQVLRNCLSGRGYRVLN
jgi:outer membrane lipoprotein SlyB